MASTPGGSHSKPRSYGAYSNALETFTTDLHDPLGDELRLNTSSDHLPSEATATDDGCNASDDHGDQDTDGPVEVVTLMQQQEKPHPSLSVTIDHTAHPHIIDRIVEFACRDALNAFRPTSKAFHARVSRILDTHIALVHLGGSIPADPEDMLSWPADLNEVERVERRWAAIRGKTLDWQSSSKWGDHVLFCSLAHAAPVAATVFRRIRVVDIHFMPDPQVLMIYQACIAAMEPELETVRLIDVTETNWAGECPIVAPTFVVFLSTSLCAFGECPDAFLRPPAQGVKKLVINFAVYQSYLGTPNSTWYVELAHIPFLTRIPDCVEDVVIILSPTSDPPEQKPLASGISKQDLFVALVDCVDRFIEDKTFTVVGMAEPAAARFRSAARGMLMYSRLRPGDMGIGDNGKPSAAQLEAREGPGVDLLLTKLSLVSREEYAQEVGEREMDLYVEPT
ncbi:uncharacterized protein EHS24_006637 [Apiotrichum porosum]|uniref:Uncharacterized protein n=1 Tax=Apiotrichum porosum TaxID=105984 RepID=A0A427Y1Q1_9TREE|nr:uncharacterized protein EHS24_006637 [Apiotrichum porosum]RSH85048.1 hypothetical protein EHS24_006637 [Apiotrichum porosum]